MANIREYRDKDGTLKSFYFKVYRGRDATGKQLKPFTSTLTVDPTWSYKRAVKEAKKYALLFEEECKHGMISIESVTLGEYMDYMIELKNDRGQLKKRTLRPQSIGISRFFLGGPCKTRTCDLQVVTLFPSIFELFLFIGSSPIWLNFQGVHVYIIP